MGAHVMLDLETWGTSAGSAIRSIGAVVFNPANSHLGSAFYTNVDYPSQAEVFLVKDPETVAWWGRQSPEAQAALETDQKPLRDALLAFSQWWAEVGGQYLWSHGANFDEVLLRACYKAADLNGVPWEFWDVRCSRTILALANRKPVRDTGIHHHALADATAQAKAVTAALRAGVKS